MRLIAAIILILIPLILYAQWGWYEDDSIIGGGDVDMSGQFFGMILGLIAYIYFNQKTGDQFMSIVGGVVVYIGGSVFSVIGALIAGFLFNKFAFSEDRDNESDQ